MSRHQITPAWQTQRGALVRASGCAAGVPVAGARVFGQTRQNLWVNPAGSYNGVTVTGNADGSMTLDGAATNTYFCRVESHALKPGVTYTLSVDKSTGEGSTGFYVNELSADGSSMNTSHYVGGTTNDALTSTFTTSADMGYVQMGVGFSSGSTPSGTYRVMLNEGPTAQPWCPPGLSSVSELETVTAGKNLASGQVWKSGYWSNTGEWIESSTYQVMNPIRISNGESYTARIERAEGDAYIRLIWLDESQGFLTRTQGTVEVYAPSPSVLDIPEGAAWLTYFGESKAYDTFQLELGSTATAYEPPAVTTTPIDLAGHQLRGLPDGTCDVLTVDGERGGGGGALVL